MLLPLVRLADRPLSRLLLRLGRLGQAPARVFAARAGHSSCRTDAGRMAGAVGGAAICSGMSTGYSEATTGSRSPVPINVILFQASLSICPLCLNPGHH